MLVESILLRNGRKMGQTTLGLAHLYIFEFTIELKVLVRLFVLTNNCIWKGRMEQRLMKVPFANSLFLAHRTPTFSSD